MSLTNKPSLEFRYRYIPLLLLVMFLWSFNPICLKVLVPSVGCCWLGFFRFFPLFIIAAIFLIGENSKISHNASKAKSSSKYILTHSIFTGTILFIQIFLFHLGSKFTSPNHVALLAFSFPLYIPFFAHFVFKIEELNWLNILGNIVAFIGVFLIFYAPGCTSYFGNFIEFFSALFTSFFMTYTKFLIIKTSGKKWTILCYQMLFASLLFLLFALFSEKINFFNLPKNVYLTLFYQVFVISIFCWSCFQFLLSKLSVVIVTSFYFLPPIFAQLINLFFGESFSYNLMTAGILIGAGIILVNLKEPRSRLTREIV